MTTPITDVRAIIQRPAETTDLDLVYDSWLRSFEDACVADFQMRKSDYYRLQRERIDRLFAGSAFVMVAHREGSPDVIDAWICLDVAPAVFHYVYTQSFQRRQGLAKMLIGERRICTHLTDSRRPDSFAAMKRRMGIRYMPHLLDGP